MAKRRERGEGSISEPNAEGVYEVSISLGVDADGKRRRVKARVRGSRAAARAKLEELRHIHALARPGTAVPTVDAYFVSWLARRRPTLAAATIRMYAGAIANLRPLIGHLRLDRLTADQVATAMHALGERKRTTRDGSGGMRTVQQAYDTLRAALAFALRKDGILRASPIAAVARPRLEREIDFLTVEESRAFLAAAADDRYRALWHLVVATGLRWGEVAALRWSDVDLAAATLTVRRALKETGEFGRPKSNSGRRTIDLPASVVSELKKHRKKGRLSEDLVFATKTGAPLHPSNLARRYFFPTLERAGLRRIRFHDLRHTAAAIRLAAGQSPLVVKELLGHSSIAVTLGVYGHLEAKASKAAAAGYDRAMASKAKPVRKAPSSEPT